VTDVAAVTDRGRVREANEDRYVTKRSAGVTLLAVADGVGGEAGGDVASAAAVDALASTFDFGARDTPAALASAVRAANDAVLRATTESGHRTAASTLVAAAVRGRQIAVANLGDSRAYLVRGGAARQITTDHAGELANSITRFVGDPRGISPDVFVEIARPRDRLVLCSDGLTKHVAPEEIGAAAGGAPERAARSLVELANSRGGQDNVTVVVYASPLVVGRTVALILLALLVLIALAGSAGALLAVPIPTSSPSPSPAASASPSPTPGEPSATPSPSPSASPSASPSP
jgi:protein phosphatase